MNDQIIKAIETADAETLARVKEALGIVDDGMPNEGAPVWWIDGDGELYGPLPFARSCHAHGWHLGFIYLSREEAEQSKLNGWDARVRAWKKLERVAARYAQPTADDWADDDVKKFTMAYDPESKAVEVDWCHHVRRTPLPHFLVKGDAEKVKAECLPELELLLGGAK